MSPVLLVARRDYFAYVGAWGFWLSLLTAPLTFFKSAATSSNTLLSKAVSFVRPYNLPNI